MSNKQPTPNDQRANVKNPNNPAYEADRNNRIEQGHPDVPTPPDAQPSTPEQSPKK
jgi:hypothetical protein